MSALLRRIHRILAKEHVGKAIKAPDSSLPSVAEVTVIRTPFDLKPIDRAETSPSPRETGWKRRLSTRRSDASTARAARDKAAQGHYVLRRSTILFPDMPDEKWDAQLYAHQNRSLHSLSVATVQFSAQVVEIPAMPKQHVQVQEPVSNIPRRAHTMSIRPKRKPVPSLYALDPDAAPLLIPLPPSPVLSACLEADGEMAELAV
ncbi:hypothetical protein CALVIDRAFT_536916 [Calocera viscosa TUFC12733]|uniref:Uncharacterized protein n=1 Tax=Calocera viscosa (strain TUFC12733) TaxID=1330018 RepID=A0A167MBI8_CALVF|nr:hypothetical protein CALVIDRAFT_536916 [Calocera viscosa TUFC12733]